MKKISLRFSILVLALVMAVGCCFTGCDTKDDTDYGSIVDFSQAGNIADITLTVTTTSDDGSSENSGSENSSGETVAPTNGNPLVAFKVKKYGTIVVELYPDIAPITVENFVNLVKSGFYDGLIFHRVMEGFMIQGGDPKGDGTGGSKENIKGEFSLNGVNNTLKHTRGVISMARSNDLDSASSQFFIMHADNAGLNGRYAAFGKVVSGMDVVDKIATCEVDDSDPNSPKPKKDVVMEKVVVDLNGYGGSSADNDNNADSDTDNKNDATTDESYSKDTNPVATIKVKDYGTIKVELYPDVAPITVENFVSLVEKGFYDGIIFHRVMEGFMIQGGDPDGNGTDGSDENIKGEFSANGVTNNLSHTRGVISMARNAYDMNSASSQFFIMHADNAGLDGQYAAFGKVIDGMDVVDKIATCEVDNPYSQSPKPVKDVVMESVTVELNGYKK